jgi:stage II sporulation protein AA (anti-sigma F factor antagonist)
MPDPIDDFAAEPSFQGDRVVVAVRGELDLATADGLNAALDRTWEAPEHPVVIDLSALRFIDSTGLRTLVAFHRRAAEAGRDCRLTGLAPDVRRTLAISGLDQVLVIEPGDDR